MESPSLLAEKAEGMYEPRCLTEEFQKKKPPISPHLHKIPSYQKANDKK